ncbi:MAG: hypothetical protein RLN90_14225 [Balneolaceae bacterium]
MNISTKLSDEQIDIKKPSNGYEWWYFDALSSDKQWGIVIIFYHGNPFSPKYIVAENGYPNQFPGISISVYKKGKPEFYSFLEYEEDKFNWDAEDHSVSIGSNIFKRTVNDEVVEYELLLAQTLASGHSINAKLKFNSSIISNNLIDYKSMGEIHFWNLIQPQSQVYGTINLNGKKNEQSINFTGTGYHDHNTGYEPMKDSFRDWYWGRFHFKESTLIYYIMNGLDNSEQYEAWLISKDGSEIIERFDQIELEYFQKSGFGLQTARKIELRSKNSKVSIQQRDRIDNGPFYQRFLSDAVMIHDGYTKASTGFTEYIKPEKIYDEKYRWMVRMRLRFMYQNPHWVQKSKMLYEWTW